MARQTFFRARRPAGFVNDVPNIRMEEDAGPSYSQEMGFASPVQFHAVIERLAEERREIINLIANERLKVAEGTKLLEQNGQLIGHVRGGPSFGTEKVIYGILVFSAIVIGLLSWLTAFHQLQPEITTTFVGTVVGGTIATIAQKLGKVGS